MHGNGCTLTPLASCNPTVQCRYANAIVFLNEMNDLTLTDESTGQPVRGEDLAATSNLNNKLSVGENLAVLLGMLVVLRLLALVALKIAYRRNWL